MRRAGRIMIALALATSVTALAQPARADADPCEHGEARALLRELRVIGAVLTVERPGCRPWTAAAGRAELGRERAMRGDERFRIGSVTKTFTATVVLQLVAEGRLELDRPVVDYLPGLVPAAITVREVLDHTSGLGDYTKALDLGRADEWRLKRYEAADLVARGVRLKGTPRGEWHYSNTNYLVAGLLVEKVTGNDVGREVTRRILRPLGLRDSSWPGNTTKIPGRHAHGYFPLPDGPADVTRSFHPSLAGASGALISTPADVNRFLAALLDGRLLPDHVLARMREGVATGNRLWPGARYGLGLVSTPSRACEGVWYGHRGSFYGYRTLAGATADGRRATVAVNAYPLPKAVETKLRELVDRALCGNAARDR
ncbi:serine hydrolase domain-containing protein [Nonomuraea sp. NPDC050310]|uniref:serine hydrolase domain-containing protein n=1 Tax=Nonomuraea sp. NPDC050310 TaxID=3154935 RepID=UPI0033FA45B3